MAPFRTSAAGSLAPRGLFDQVGDLFRAAPRQRHAGARMAVVVDQVGAIHAVGVELQSDATGLAGRKPTWCSRISARASSGTTSVHRSTIAAALAGFGVVSHSPGSEVPPRTQSRARGWT